MLEGQESVAEEKAGGRVDYVAGSQTGRRAKMNLERKARDWW